MFEPSLIFQPRLKFFRFGLLVLGMFPPRHLSDDSHKWDNCSMEHSCTLYLKFSKIYPILDILFSKTSLFYIVILQLGHTIKPIIYSFFWFSINVRRERNVSRKIEKIFVCFVFRISQKPQGFKFYYVFFLHFFQIPFFSQNFCISYFAKISHFFAKQIEAEQIFKSFKRFK